MRIIGTPIKEIKAERRDLKPDEKLRGANIKLEVKDVKKVDLEISDEVGASVVYEFTVEYPTEKKKKFATIVVSGEVVFVDAKDNVEAAVKTWKKNKKIEKYPGLVDLGFEKGVTEALFISQRLGLPPPVSIISLVKAGSRQQGQNYIG